MLKRFVWFLCLISALLLGQNLSLLAQETVTGDWVLTVTPNGLPSFTGKVTFKVEGSKLTGNFARTPLDGIVSGNNVQWVEKPRMGGASEYNGTFSNGTISGTVVLPNENPDWAKGTFIATRFPQRPPGPPRTIDFTPTTFSQEYSDAVKPSLTIWPGDTVRTSTLDAGGKDKNGLQRGWGGNPLTGPFYIQGVMRGDTIAVHLKRVRLNRDWAISDDNVVGRVMGSPLTITLLKGRKGNIKWHLDIERGLASPDPPDEDMKQFAIPVRPFLGCVAIAPGGTPINSHDSGGFGGNMDFNEITEGTTLYFKAAVPGALLYIGDGHALQGDGELNGNALETSMDVEFSVDIVPNGPSQVTPRAESPTHIMAIGLAGSYDDSLRDATFSMVQWLEHYYKLNSSEIAEILGTCMEYRIFEIADRNVGVAAMIRKDKLKGLIPNKP